jgi:hypothetical protein
LLLYLFFGNLLKLALYLTSFFFFSFFWLMQACSTDVNFMGFRILASVGQDETRAKGKKNMASSDKGKGKKGVSCYLTFLLFVNFL